MQKTMTQLVREFHDKHGFDRDLAVDDCKCDAASYELELAGKILHGLSVKLAKGTINAGGKDLPFNSRLMRAHLILEEAAEVMHALAEGDEVKLADGLGDLDYVVHGAAVAFGIPLDEVGQEIHRSNMTKAVRTPGVDDPRLRNKGASYQPPNLKKVLEDAKIRR